MPTGAGFEMATGQRAALPLLPLLPLLVLLVEVRIAAPLEIRKIEDCVRAKRRVVIHIPKSGGTEAKEVITYPRPVTPANAPPLPLLLGNATCNWHHVPPRYFPRPGDATTNPYLGYRTICFLRDPISRWVSEFGYRKLSHGASGDPRSAGKIKYLNDYTRRLLRDLLGDPNAARAAVPPARYVPALKHPTAKTSDTNHRLSLDTIDVDPIFDCHLIPQHVYVFADGNGEVPLCHELYPIANLSDVVSRIRDETTCTTRDRGKGGKSNSAHHKLRGDDLAPDLQEGLRRLYARDYGLLGAYF